MSSIATTADNSAARKSLIGDDDDSLNIKEEMNYLIKEVDTLNANLVEKNREIDYLTSRLQDQIELEKIIADLEKKLQQALSENHELKEAQAATQSQIQSKYIEKSQHNKEIVELKAKANYLTSENERLNKIINSKLEAWQTRGGDRDDSGPDEDEKSELVGKLESYTKENERLLKTVEDNAIEILEWKNKNTDLEAEVNKLKAHMKEDEEEIIALKKENEEMEKHIVELKAKKERLEHEHDQSQGEHDKLVKSVEAKKKEIEEMKSKMAALEKKDVELGYLKERFQLTVKDNEDLHMKIATKEYEIETLESKCEEFDKKLALIKELEGTINKLNIEKDEFAIRLESKNKKLEEQKEINQNLITELSEVQANLGFMEDENNELRQITEGYERMIEDLKNTVVKGEKGTYRVLSFDPDSLA